MAKKQGLTIPWVLAPKDIDTNHDTNLLKIIAMVCMLCDHAGKMLFPQYRILRLIGRIAMPIFAYAIAVGCVYTKNHLRYLKRIVVLALISQPIYAVAMGHTTSAMFQYSLSAQPVRAVLTFYVESWHHPSILLTLALGLILLWALREKQIVLFLAAFLFCWKIQGSLDYGIRGIILILLFYTLCQKWWVSLPIVAAYMIWWGMQTSGYNVFGIEFGSQMFAVLSLALIYPHMKTGIRMNKWIFYGFYPLHLAAIWAAQYFGI